MKKFKDIRIGIRLNLTLTTAIIILLSAFGVYTYNSQMTSYLSEADVQMHEELKDLSLFVNQISRVDKTKQAEFTSEQLAEVKSIFKNKVYYNLGYPYLVKTNGDILVHPDIEGKSIANYDFFKQILNSGSNSGSLHYNWEGQEKVQYFNYLEGLDAYVVVTFYEKDLKERVQKTIYTLVVVVVILVVVFFFIILFLSRSITSVLKKAVKFAESIAAGDLTTNLEVKQKDEIGQLALSLQTMKLKLTNIIDDVVESAQIIATASDQLSSNSSEQAAATEEVSSSMEQMKANVEQNAENAEQTDRIAKRAYTEIGQGYESVRQTVKSMQEIAEKITVIEEIAEKTDLLAINAAIEAARAGEHGKGFAVVAMEVRKLAERSQQAAAQINSLSRSSVGIAQEAGDKMAKIVPEIEKTSTLIQEIAAASKEQNTGTEQVNTALLQLNSTNQQTAANAEELAGQANQLKEIITFFKVSKSSSNQSKTISSNKYKSRLKDTSDDYLFTEKETELEFESAL